jgi:hypothetical protein
LKALASRSNGDPVDCYTATLNYSIVRRVNSIPAFHDKTDIGSGITLHNVDASCFTRISACARHCRAGTISALVTVMIDPSITITGPK